MTDNIMLIDTTSHAFDMQTIQNRRFMYSSKTATLILGHQYSRGGIEQSHAYEHERSGVAEPYDNFIRGWVGVSREYSVGVIHFAPNIPKEAVDFFNRAFSTLEMFLENGGRGETVIRGFGDKWEQPLMALLPVAGKVSLRENLKKKGEQAKAQAAPDTHPKPRTPER